MRLILEVHPTHPSLSPTHICRPLAAIAGMGSIAGGHLQNLGVAAMQSVIPGKKIKQKANASGHLAPSKAHMATLRGRSKTIGQATVSSTHKAFPKLQGPCEDQKTIYAKCTRQDVTCIVVFDRTCNFEAKSCHSPSRHQITGNIDICR